MPKQKPAKPLTKLTKRERVKERKAAEPFSLLESDPTNFWGDDELKSDTEVKVSPKSSNRGKPKKVLTSLKRFAILRTVNKAKRKGDKIMATDNKNTSKKTSKGGALKSIAWLAFAAQQGFVGYVLLANFGNYFVVAAAIASLLIAGVIVVAHFINAHKG
jgi:hypothetical protein